MDDFACPEISLGEWGKDLRASMQGRRLPLGATLEVTERCNMACVHCYINQPAVARQALATEMSLEEIKVVLAQMLKAGVLHLLLTGGEVFLRADFSEIYKYAKQLGFLVTIFTNATLITPRIAELLAEWPPYLIEITLYGHSKEVYEKITGIPGSFDRCRSGIDLLLEKSLRVRLKAVVISLNKHELAQMKEWSQNRGVPFRYDAMLWPRLDGDTKPCDYRLSVEEVIALDREDPQRKEILINAYSENGPFTRSEYVYGCGAGLYSFHVSSDGRMSMCIMAREPAYDLRHGNFEEGWQLLGAIRGKKRKQTSICQTCDVGTLCPQCPGWSQVVHGDDETVVDIVCETARARVALINSIS